MNICEHLSVTAKLIPDREAIVFEGKRFSYSQLDQLSSAAAKRLNAAGVEQGDRVALMLANVPAFAVWYYAALRLGAIAVSVSTRLAAKEVAFVLSDCSATALVADPATMASVGASIEGDLTKSFETSELGDTCDGIAFELDGLPPSEWIDTDPNDAALILYTSGTTGFAKGATLSHMNVRSNVHAFNHLCNMQSEDRILLAVPLFHCFGQNALLNSAFNAGATLVLQRKFDPSESKRLIADERVTQLYGVPTMFQLFHESCQPADLATVNYCFSAAAPLPIQVSRRWQERFGMPIYEGYGLTETSPFASYNHRLHFLPGSIGTPIDSVEMKIVNTETGQTCRPGDLGEIAIRGPNVMLGYWNRPEDTAAAIRDGWFYSGDIGRVDEKGFFYIVDRVKDMIAVGGLKVYPAEVERVLLDHPAVSQVAVVGFPNDVFGEQVVGFVVRAEEAGDSGGRSAAEIRQHAKDNLANYKVPRQIVFVDELPRNPSGKVLKTQLRDFDLQALAASHEANLDGVDDHVTSATHASPEHRPEPTLRKQLESTHAASRRRVANMFVQNLVQAISGSDDLPEPECRFLDAGLDSLMIVEMSSRVQVEVGSEREVPATLVFDHPRICDLADFLVETLTPTGADDGAASSSPRSAADNHAAPIDSDLHEKIESMSEEQALEELLKEIED